MADDSPSGQSSEPSAGTSRPVVLFLCTGNSARSIMAEALVNFWGKGWFQGYSAGSFPKSVPHPFALALLSKLGFETKEFHSKSWSVFAQPDAPQMDFVFTVCDEAAKEPCPVWPGQPVTAHWGVADPAAVEGIEIRGRGNRHFFGRRP